MNGPELPNRETRRSLPAILPQHAKVVERRLIAGPCRLFEQGRHLLLIISLRIGNLRIEENGETPVTGSGPFRRGLWNTRGKSDADN